MYRRAAFAGFACLLLTWLSSALQGQDRSPELNTSSTVPVISIETSVPGEINIGTSAQFVISVKNSGKALAEGVAIQTTLPATVKFLQATPAPSTAGERVIQFELGDLPPGTVRRITMQLMPEKTGPVDLQTKAFFAASTQSALHVRQPEIAIRCGGPETVQVGEKVTFWVVLENVGDGPAHNVVLTPRLPENSFIATQIPRPAKLAAIGARQPQQFTFTVQANHPGVLEGTFLASAQGTRDVQCGHRVKVLRPDLRVELSGTPVRFLGSQGEYTIRTWNPGDTVLRDVEVTLHGVPGLEINALSQEAIVDSKELTYTWCLVKLSPGESHLIRLKAKAAKLGAQLQCVAAMTEPRLSVESTHLTHVISRADVDVAVSNTKEAVEVGQPETFMIAVVNRGSRTAEAVKVTVQLPKGLQPLATDGSTAAGDVQFPEFRLNPAESKTLTFPAVGVAAGEHAVRATVETEFAAVPTIAETVVYFYDEGELQRIARELDAKVQMR